ncbi:MAG: amidohydrolase, partial [Deltaproteobacteria bacterium]|nr:amidohydrolase [Deltaproteobacteria bacterium]
MRIDCMAEAQAVAYDVIAWRRHIHANPEAAFHEKETAAFVSETLRGFGYSPAPVGKTGLMAVLEGALPGKTLGLRADMDALPGTETTGLPFASRNPGLMHACGHDAHTAILLGVAKVMAAYKNVLPGRIKFFFQPAEEPLAGARTFVTAGELDDVDGLAALHVMPNLETGCIGTRAGVLMAASDTFTITVSGKASHGAEPHHGIDAILIASHIVTALQSVVSRNVGPLDSA